MSGSLFYRKAAQHGEKTGGKRKIFTAEAQSAQRQEEEEKKKFEG